MINYNYYWKVFLCTSLRKPMIYIIPVYEIYYIEMRMMQPLRCLLERLFLALARNATELSKIIIPAKRNFPNKTTANAYFSDMPRVWLVKLYILIWVVYIVCDVKVFIKLNISEIIKCCKGMDRSGYWEIYQYVSNQMCHNSLQTLSGTYIYIDLYIKSKSTWWQWY